MALKDSIVATRSEMLRVIGEIVNQPMTPGQLTMQRNHGTPMEFAKACIDAIGEVSCDEAIDAVRKYVEDWNKA